MTSHWPSGKLLFLNVPLIIFVVGAIYPWRDGIAEGFFANQIIMQIGLIILCGVLSSIVVLRFSLKSKSHGLLIWGGAVCYAGGLVSVFFAMSIPHAGMEFLHWVLLGVFLFYCVNLATSKNNVLILGVALLFNHGLLVFLACLYLLFALINNDSLQAAVIYPASENIRFFNQVQIFILPLLLLLLKHPRVWLVASIFFMANILLICIGGARGAGLCIALLLLLVGWLDKSLRGHVFRGVVAGVIAVLLYVGLWLLQPVGLQDISRSGTSGRLDMWLDLISRLEWHHWFWGIGPANYALLDHPFMFGHPHNSVLQWILEWGMLSFLGLAVVVGHIVFKSVSYVKNNPEDLITKGLLLSSLAALAYSLVDGVIVMPIAQTLLIVFLGLLYGRVVQRVENATEQTASLPSPRRSLMIGLFVLMITVPYVYLVSQYYLQQSVNYDNVVGPRFWINGVPLQWPE